MITEDQVARLFAEANPVPSLDVLDSIEPAAIESIVNRSEEGDAMTQADMARAQHNRRRSVRGLLIAAGVAMAVIAVGLVLFTSPSQTAATTVGRAIAFWEAVGNDDREQAIGYLDPAQVETGVFNLFGRAHTIAGQFEWYEAVGFRWSLEGCDETAEGNIECNVNAHNAWSDAIGVEPVSGVYFMEFGPNGITNVVENRASFTRQWLPDVYEVFRRWVEIHHPEDVSTMWNDSELTPEGLELFRVNTSRFVEAYPSE